MRVLKRYTFEAAHMLPRHNGKCKFLHGHSYCLEVSISGLVNAETGFVVDFGDIDRVVKPVADFLDHKFLNAFIKYPSSEVIAWCIWSKIFDKRRVISVMVSETEKTACYCTGEITEEYALDSMCGPPELNELAPFPVPSGHPYFGDWKLYVEDLQVQWKKLLIDASEVWKGVDPWN